MRVSLGSAQVSSGFFVPASKSRSVSGSIHLFLTFAHGVCASSAGPFLADAPSLVSKAEVSGPRQEGLRGHSPSGPEQLLVGCSAEEILLPRLPRLLSTSLLCRQVLAPPLYLIALRKSGGMVTHGAGDGHQPSTVSQTPFSQFTWVKKTKHKDGAAVLSPFHL